MVQGRKEADGSEELDAQPNGLRVRFVNPKNFRAYIYDPDRQMNRGFAERLAGISETDLGTFRLDGQLFESVKFTLLTEPDEDLRKGRPTAIIRADFEIGGLIGGEFSRIEDGQISSWFNDSPEPSWLEEFASRFDEDASVNTDVRSPWVARFYSQSTEQFTGLAILQILDKDVGPGFISLSLVSPLRYSKQWLRKHNFYHQRKEEGWEVDFNDVDSWRFTGKVGFDVFDEQSFKQALEYYEHCFSRVLGEIYKSEGLPVPDLEINLEAPLILSRDETVTFDDIGGQRNAVLDLQAVAQSEKGQKRVSPTQSPILLYGESGNGKTSLAMALATELEIQPVIKEPSDIALGAEPDEIIRFFESAYLEARARAVRTNSKSMLLLEQVASILGDNKRVHESFKALLERWKIEGEVLVVATASTGTFTAGVLNMFEAIPVLSPDTVEKKEEILRKQARKLGKALGRDVFGDVEFDRVARILRGPFSGRDVAKLLSAIYRRNRLDSESSGASMTITTEYVIGLMLVP